MVKQTGIERVQEVFVGASKRVEVELGRYVEEARKSRETIAALQNELANLRAKVAPFRESEFLRYQKEARESRGIIRDLKAKVNPFAQSEFLRYQKEARASRGTIQVLQDRVEELEAELEEAGDCAGCGKLPAKQVAAVTALREAAELAITTANRRGTLASTSSKFAGLKAAAAKVAKLVG